MSTPTVSVVMITFLGETSHLVNALRSLDALMPDEVCIVDTSKAPLDRRRHFYTWLDQECRNLGLPLRIAHREWDNNYAASRNRALDMCTSDWVLIMDSDEMLTFQVATQLRGYLETLPEHVLAVRVGRLNLLDGRRTLAEGLWPPSRPGKGVHPRIVRAGTGRYVGINHPEYHYPGRSDIPWDSLSHPKWDWRGAYFLHLFLYKDNVMRRLAKPTPAPLDGLPLDAEPDVLWQAMQNLVLEHQGWHAVEIPKGARRWVPIVWTIDPAQWIIHQEHGRYCYRERYRQGGR